MLMCEKIDGITKYEKIVGKISSESSNPIGDFICKMNGDHVYQKNPYHHNCFTSFCVCVFWFILFIIFFSSFPAYIYWMIILFPNMFPQGMLIILGIITSILFILSPYFFKKGLKRIILFKILIKIRKRLTNKFIEIYKIKDEKSQLSAINRFENECEYFGRFKSAGIDEFNRSRIQKYISSDEGKNSRVYKKYAIPIYDYCADQEGADDLVDGKKCAGNIFQELKNKKKISDYHYRCLKGGYCEMLENEDIDITDDEISNFEKGEFDELVKLMNKNAKEIKKNSKPKTPGGLSPGTIIILSIISIALVISDFINRKLSLFYIAVAFIISIVIIIVNIIKRKNFRETILDIVTILL